MTNLISKHGGYENLKSFQMSVIIYDLTVEFCGKYVTSFKLKDQLEGAARSGSQNIGEGSDNSATSKQTEIRLVNVAKGSLKELKLDMEAFLRQHNLAIWPKEDPRALEIRQLCYKSNKSHKTYSSYMSNSESAVNCLLCLINQTTFLLDRQLIVLGKNLVEQGDFKDRYKEVRKGQLVNDGPPVKEFLKDFGIKFDENGLVIYENKPKPKQDS